VLCYPFLDSEQESGATYEDQTSSKCGDTSNGNWAAQQPCGSTFCKALLTPDWEAPQHDRYTRSEGSALLSQGIELVLDEFLPNRAEHVDVDLLCVKRAPDLLDGAVWVSDLPKRRPRFAGIDQVQLLLARLSSPELVVPDEEVCPLRL
jgi:hypothetical protein